MYYWLLTVSVVVFFGYFSGSKYLSWRLKIFSYMLLAFALTFLSGFRDGLGTDYYNYVDAIQWKSERITLLEPTYTIFANLAKSSYFSELIFFVFFSSLTIFFTFLAYRHSRDVFLTVLIFAFHPLIYFGSFNLVRQFGAAAILLFSVRYLVDLRVIRYALFSMFALTIHVSAMFFILISPFLLVRVRAIFHVLLIVVSVILGSIVDLDLSGLVAKIGVYSHYENYEYALSVGLSVYIFTLIYIFFLLRFDSAHVGRLENAYLNMTTGFFIFINLMPALYIMYRVAILFILALPIVFANNLRDRFETRVFKWFVFVAVAAFFSFFLYINRDNDSVVPGAFLSPMKVLMVDFF